MLGHRCKLVMGWFETMVVIVLYPWCLGTVQALWLEISPPEAHDKGDGEGHKLHDGKHARTEEEAHNSSDVSCRTYD